MMLLILALIVIYVDYRITWHNCPVCGAGTDCVYNGFGACKLVLEGKATLPAAYRVLVPWLTQGNKTAYAILRWVSIYFALWAADLWFVSDMQTVALALFFIVSALFDYTDNYLEVGFFALAFWLIINEPANYQLYLCGVTALATFNRGETALFIPISILLSSNHCYGAFTLLCVFLWASILVRMIYGWKKERYCPFNMIWFNIKRIKTGYMAREYGLFALLVLVSIYALFFGEHVYIPFEISMYIMAGALVVPTIWAEIRVFQTFMLILIPMLVK